MKEAPGSSETSVLTRATRRNNPEDTILHVLDSSQSVREMITWTKNKEMYLGSRARLAHKADNLTAICEQIV
jgi:hypothetical protein